MKHSKRIILTTVMAIIAICAMAQRQHHVVNVGDFSTLRVAHGVRTIVSVNADSAGMAAFDAPVEIVSSLLFENNRKGKLVVKIDRNVAPEGTKMPVLRLWTSMLTNVEAASDSTINVQGLVKVGQELKLKADKGGRIVAPEVEAPTVTATINAGGGKIYVGGKCSVANLTCTGVNEIQADHLEAKDVNVRMYGTGTIGCWVAGGDLTVKGAGNGNVYHKGTPANTVIKQIGTIKVQPM